MGVGIDLVDLEAFAQQLEDRASTFVRRHWVGVTAAAIVFVALSAALVFSLRQVDRAVEAGRVATDKSQLAEARLANLMGFRREMLNNVAPAVSGMPGAMDVSDRIIKAVMISLDGETAALDGDAKRTDELIESYLALADVQGHPRAMNRGRVDAAEKSLLKAEELSVQLVAAQPDSRRAAWLRARVGVTFGSFLIHKGDFDAAESNLVQAVELIDRVLAEPEALGRSRLLYERHTAFRNLSNLAQKRGLFALGLERALEAEATLLKEMAEFPEYSYFRKGSLALARVDLADIASRQGRPGEALELAAAEKASFEESMRSHAPNAGTEMIRESLFQVLATGHAGLGQEDEAIEAMQASVAASLTAMEADLDDISTLEFAVSSYIGLGELCLEFERFEQGQEALVAAQALADKNVRQRQGSYRNVNRRIDIESGLARCAASRGDYAEALRLAASAVERLDRIEGEFGRRFKMRRRRARLEWTLGEIYDLQASASTQPGSSLQLARAIEHLEAAVGLYQALVDEGLGGVLPGESAAKVRVHLDEIRRR